MISFMETPKNKKRVATPSVYLRSVAESTWKKQFSLGAELGRGQFGVVYKAYDVQSTMDVALKVVQHGEDELRSVSIEFNTVQSKNLKHTNLVSFIDAFQTKHDGQPVLVIVMEYADGIDLSKIEGKLIRRTDVLEIVKQLFGVLGYLHSNDIVHRDIKPDNIMLLNYPGKTQIKLVDLGFICLVSKRLEDKESCDFPRGADAFIPADLKKAIEEDTWTDATWKAADVFAATQSIYVLFNKKPSTDEFRKPAIRGIGEKIPDLTEDSESFLHALIKDGLSDTMHARPTAHVISNMAHMLLGESGKRKRTDST